tara:strand:+ start:271 stop:438 length:168 start_codon:yes stop_codon:yes gene_type:complete
MRLFKADRTGIFGILTPLIKSGRSQMIVFVYQNNRDFYYLIKIVGFVTMSGNRQS